jgi:hypothetical protein
MVSCPKVDDSFCNVIGRLADSINASRGIIPKCQAILLNLAEKVGKHSAQLEETSPSG